jgi:iron complex transport system ATP-binding protein
MSALQTRGLNVTIDGRCLLDGIDLALGAGERLGVLGPNGAGKSTLLKALAGLLPCGGELLLAGRDPRRLGSRARARAVALLPQRLPEADGFTVDEYLALARYPHQAWLAGEGPADRERLAAVRAWCRLEAFRDRRLETLSAGECQRVALAAALAQQTPLLLLDEPASALDVAQRGLLWEVLEERRRQEGLSIVHVGHDPWEVLTRSERVLALRQGRLHHAGPGGSAGGGPWLAELYRLPFRRLEDADGSVWWLPEPPAGGGMR